MKSDASTRLKKLNEYNPDQQVEQKQEDDFKNEVIFEQQLGSGEQ